MDGRTWLLAGAVAAPLLAVLPVFALRRRRRTRADGPEETMRRARQAIRASGHEQRRQRRGSLRGKGYGGDDNRAYDSGVASDSGGMP
ncbi:hypothetical protein [Micromonospora sp. NPDC005237]|uniref:hypothetical protein n=1 Tax=Micromonospora sp. NPDC005237 TaxID=3155113 RepID=UPI0033BB198C